MSQRHNTFGLCFGIAAVLGLFTGPTAKADNGPKEDGFAVQARGPVHEAFAQPVEPAAPGLAIPKAPPEPITELPPDQKPDNPSAQWIPGYWGWDSDKNDFLWISGCWRVPPLERRWVPGHWARANDGGWQWASGFWAPEQLAEIQYLQAPPAPLDAGPVGSAPTAGNTWVPGSWVYRGNTYNWRPGYWLPYEAGWSWVPPRFCWTPSGYIFVEGFWDYGLDSRGLLFAPISFSAPLWNTPGWAYRPWYTVGWNGLLASLFIRPSYCHYYFGDYYGANYGRLGFQPWVTYGPGSYDPLFNYYWGYHRGDPGWYRNLRNTHAERFDGRAARPPRTLAEQRAVLQTAGASAKTVPLVTPLDQARPGTGKLVPVRAAQLTEERAAAQRITALSRQRADLERPAPRPTQAAASPPSTGSGTALRLDAKATSASAPASPPQPPAPKSGPPAAALILPSAPPAAKPPSAPAQAAVPPPGNVPRPPAAPRPPQAAPRPPSSPPKSGGPVGGRPQATNKTGAPQK